MLFLVALAVAAVVGGGAALSGCGDKKKSGGNGNYTDDVQEDTADASDGFMDTRSDAAEVEAGPTEVEADVDPNRVKEGVYRFMKLKCDVADIDIEDGDKLIGLCRDLMPTENMKNFFKTTIDDPTKERIASFGHALADKTNVQYGTSVLEYETRPEQILRAGFGESNEVYMVPYSGVVPEGMTDAPCLSAISFASAGYTHANDVLPFTITEFPAPLRPCGVTSALVAYNEDGPEVWMPATVETSDGDVGILRALDAIKATGTDNAAQYEFDQNTFPVFLSGRRPSAIVDVSDIYDPEDASEYGFAAVLSTEGYGLNPPDGKSVNACIDIVELDHLPDEEPSIKKTIDLGVASVFPHKELPVTEDRNYAAVLAENKLIVVDLVGLNVASSISVSMGIDDVQDMVIENDRAYVSFNDADNGGQISIFDISDPTNPIHEQTVPVADEVGVLDVDGEDRIFVEVTAPEGSKHKREIHYVRPDEVTE